eukprot:GHUV01032659.1.p1 GENE.GHUV01032659.1~~GHUV01032659.1.p1  ORF type:complete len:119 (+),score=9.37 GHUV01032659.1:176-532(+)
MCSTNRQCQHGTGSCTACYSHWSRDPDADRWVATSSMLQCYLTFTMAGHTSQSYWCVRGSLRLAFSPGWAKGHVVHSWLQLQYRRNSQNIWRLKQVFKDLDVRSTAKKYRALDVPSRL